MFRSSNKNRSAAQTHMNRAERSGPAATYLSIFAVTVFSSAAICCSCLLLGLGMMDISFFYNYFEHPVLFLLNWLPVLIIQTAFLCVFNRQWVSFLCTSVIFIAASVGDFFKLKFRNEPFLFSDLSSVGTALRVANHYDMTPNLRLILAVLLIILGSLFLGFFIHQRMNLRARGILLFLIALSLYPLWRNVYSNEELYNSGLTGSSQVIPGWTQQQQVSKGFIYQFIYSIKDTYSGESYNEAEAAVLLESEDTGDSRIPDNKRVNILAFQLEAFCDLTELGISGIRDDVYEGFHQLQKEGISGQQITSVFAGGTVFTERCFLSGNYKMPEYRKPALTYVWFLRNQGYMTTGSHPNHQAFYNRGNVMSYMGFQEYWFTENRYQTQLADLTNPWLCDHILIPEATQDFISKCRDGNSVFSFNVTIQGHSPYSSDQYEYDQQYWNGDSYSAETQYILNNYLGSVKETSDLLLQVSNELRSLDVPTVLMFYGDHKPWLGDGNSVYKELGIDLNVHDAETLLNRFSTPYVIWANPAAQTMLETEFSGSGPLISSGYLMNVLFQALGWEGNSVMRFTDRVLTSLPVINTDGFYYEDGQFTSQLSENGSLLLQQYDNLMYYISTHPELVPSA
ncbi:MAG: LTA synthase family protein [Oscillospiraceae bacterium]|nr:LTA synthase family protein [Oscillospiraceae bacterium]